VLAALLATLVLGAPNVSVKVDQARDVRPDEIERLMETFAGLIRASERNVEVWAEQTAETVLALDLEGAPGKIRVTAELRPSNPKKKLILDIPRDERGWRESLAPLVLDYFPPPPPKLDTRPSATANLVAPVIEEEKTSYFPYALVAGSLVAGGAATVFGAATLRNERRLERQELAPEEVDELSSAANTRALATNVLAGTAILAAGAAITWWILE
jgi:hypothetical protein